MRINSGVIYTRFTHRPQERSLQRTPMQIVAVAFAASALAFGTSALAAGAPSPDVSAALAAAVADPSRPDSDTTRAAADVTETLHRIESSTVHREVEALGFKFDSESSILANPADPRTAKVFDPTIRGHTDQFVLQFRKPKS
jgi:predicted methyltransferase